MNRWIAVALAGLVAGGIFAATLASGIVPNPFAASGRGGSALVGGPFTLVDHKGDAVTDANFRGQYMLIYFGFAHCPDICPSALQVMSVALDTLGAKAEKITPIFISVDPERDKPEDMAAYVSAFHPRLIGLTGSLQQVEQAAKAYRVFYRKVDDPGSDAAYTVDHSSIIYLMGPDGLFLTHFTHGTPVDVMVQRLKELVAT